MIIIKIVNSNLNDSRGKMLLKIMAMIAVFV